MLPQHNRAFPLGRVLLKVQQGMIHRRPHLLFMAFGQFPSHLQTTVSSAVVLEFLEQRDQAVRRFVQHRCAGFMADGFEAGPPFLAFGRQKSFCLLYTSPSPRD